MWNIWTTILLFAKLFKFNPRKCNSASSFSRCVHSDNSKCLIALTTDAEHARVFEKTIIGGFSFRRKKLKGFIWFTNWQEKTNKNNIDKNFKDGWKQPVRPKPLPITEDSIGHLFIVHIKFHNKNLKMLFLMKFFL